MPAILAALLVLADVPGPDLTAVDHVWELATLTAEQACALNGHRATFVVLLDSLPDDWGGRVWFDADSLELVYRSVGPPPGVDVSAVGGVLLVEGVLEAHRHGAWIGPGGVVPPFTVYRVVVERLR